MSDDDAPDTTSESESEAKPPGALDESDEPTASTEHDTANASEPDSKTGARRSLAVPAWAAGALAVLVAVGGGFAIGRATADDNSGVMNSRPASAVRPAPNGNGSTNGRNLPPLRNGGPGQPGGPRGGQPGGGEQGGPQLRGPQGPNQNENNGNRQSNNEGSEYDRGSSNTSS